LRRAYRCPTFRAATYSTPDSYRWATGRLPDAESNLSWSRSRSCARSSEAPRQHHRRIRQRDLLLRAAFHVLHDTDAAGLLIRRHEQNQCLAARVGILELTRELDGIPLAGSLWKRFGADTRLAQVIGERDSFHRIHTRRDHDQHRARVRVPRPPAL